MSSPEASGMTSLRADAPATWEPTDANAAPATTTATRGAWGMLAEIVFVCAAGLLLIAVADSAARLDYVWAEFVFIVGLIASFAPPALRLASTSASRRERIGLVISVGLVCYFVKVLHSPVGFTFYDEFSHWRTVLDIIRYNHLFHENPLQPVSTLYPGLEIVAAALSSVSGLPVFQAGILLLAIARLVFVLSLYMFYEHISGSERIAGLAAMLYTANPNYLFFDAQFSYESLSLPLFAMVIYILARRNTTQSWDRVGLTVALLGGLGAVMVTHHVTTYALVVLLILWQIAAFVRRRQIGNQGLGQAPLITLILALTWMAFAALMTVGYLAPHFIGGVVELFHMIAGEAEPRQLFQANSGDVAPVWERILSFGAVFCILGALPWGLLRIWRVYRDNPPVLALAALTLLYPGTLALRFTRRGSETSNRASEFLFIGIAFILAVVVAEIWLAHRQGRLRLTLFTGWVTVLFIGGMLVGFARWARLPGPYLVTADTRSVEAQGLSAAQWALTHLGPDNRISADRINRMLMGTHGIQRPVTGYGDRVDVWVPYFAPEGNARIAEVIKQGQIRYLVADQRLTTSVPVAAGYFERGERYYRFRTAPMETEALAKLDRAEDMSRIYDGGNIRIFDVGAISRDP